jgi:cyanophycinase-like exopeptidase
LTGSLVLCGGSEFEPNSLPISRAILQLVKSRDQRVSIIPVAADNPRKVSKTGLGHFRSLNVTAESILASDSEALNDASISTLIETTHVIYLSDGNPLGAVEMLRDTETYKKVTHYWKSGTILAVSGASAMALCDYYWDSGAWEQGLGLIKGLVVIPHFQYIVGRFSAERLLKDLPTGYTIIGIDDSTGVLITEQKARVVGADTVSVYSVQDGAIQESEYTDGKSFLVHKPVSD